MFHSKRHKLFNGIELISVKKDTQIFSIHVGIKVGSLYEKDEERGISHFIEHMLFKGTSKKDNEKLNNQLESLGGEYNAYTDHNCTVYSVTALSEEFENSIELLSDMMKNSIFPEEEMKKERDVILSEIRTSRDDIEDYSFKRINEVGFRNSPLKYHTLGTEKHLNSFSRETLLNFYHKYYVPNNCYVSIVSSYEHDYVLEIINKYFNNWISKDFTINNVLQENNTPGIFTSYKNDIEQSTILYLYTFHNLDKHQELALKILNHKLGDSANSILFRKLREERGLAYDVYTSLDTTNCVKSLYIYTAVGEEKVDETIKTIDMCIEDIKKENILFDDSTINLMKKVLKTAVAFTLEDVTDLSNYIFHQMIDGENIFAFIEDMKKLDDVKREDIYNVGRTVLNNPTVHILKNKR